MRYVLLFAAALPCMLASTSCGHEAQPAAAAEERSAPAMTREHGHIVIP
jgi:hypothetical protein